MTVRPFEEYKEDIAANYRQIEAAMADNNRSAAMGAYQGLAIETGVMLDNYAGLFEPAQRQAICQKLADTGLAIAAPGTPNDDQDKNPMKFEREMFGDAMRLAGQIAIEHGFPDIQKTLSGGKAPGNFTGKPTIPSP